MRPVDQEHRASLRDYYQRIKRSRLAPLWERLNDLLPAEPSVRARPYLWNYDALRPNLLKSAELIRQEEAERRVLILENPGLQGESAATDTLFAGLQLIMPGERAPAHRHTPAALRFVLESNDAYTDVENERFEMRRGDVILTPGWSWHGHAHEGSEPVIWLDVLDLPTVKMLGPRFAERRDRQIPEPVPGNENPRPYGARMAPVGSEGVVAGSPIRYPYTRADEMLAYLSAESELDPALGIKMEYIDPLSGGAVLPTLSAFMQVFPAGFTGKAYRSTENSIYCTFEGSGRVRIGANEDAVYFEYKTNDVFVVPCWHEHAFSATERTVLFSASDRATQTRLGIWRERRG